MQLLLLLQLVASIRISSSESELTSINCELGTDNLKLRHSPTVLHERREATVDCLLDPSKPDTMTRFYFDSDSRVSSNFTLEAQMTAMRIGSCDGDEVPELISLVCPDAAVQPEVMKAAIAAYSRDNYRCSPELHGGPHTIAATEPKGYTGWSQNLIQKDKVSFKYSNEEYAPIYFNADSLYKKLWFTPGGYADANFVSESNYYVTIREGPNNKGVKIERTLQRFYNSQIGQFDWDSNLNKPHLYPHQFTPGGFFQLEFDTHGFPINPCGRTGVIGRGRLGQWGPQFAADPIITRTTAQGVVEVLTITRGEQNAAGQNYIAIPGGILDRVRSSGIPDKSESATIAGARELNEETGINIDVFAPDAVEIYVGYADDLRNTDNAWMETTVIWRHIQPDYEIVKLFSEKKAIEDYKEAVASLRSKIPALEKSLKSDNKAKPGMSGPAPTKKQALTQETLRKLKDTIVYFTQDSDLETLDKTEPINSRNWYPLKDLVKGRFAHRMFASHRYFVRRVWDLLGTKEHSLKKKTVPKPN